jgi:ABC-type lipoprotein release transport system permease subunit
MRKSLTTRFVLVAILWLVLGALGLWTMSGRGLSLLTGVVAAYVPSRRAARIDPVSALRME